MPTERETFFIGICVRVSDAAAFVEVRMQRHGTRIRDVSGSSRLLFPPNGAVELAGASAGSLNPGDWVAFHVVSDTPQGASVLRVTEHRRLLPLEDLSELGSSESARRLLVEDGRANGVPGELMVRIGEREMVRIQLAREQDGRWRATASGEMPRLAVWRFDPKLCLSVPAGSQTMTILDPSERFVQIGTLDWSRDADFVRRIIRSLTRVEAGEDKALRQFAEALGRFADSLQRGASPPQAVDSRIAQEILRIRNLASMLSDQQDLLGAYYEALRDDPEVKSVLETKIAAVAQQTVESERKILIERLTAELEQDFAALRAEREADVRKSAEDLGSEMTRELEASVEALSATEADVLEALERMRTQREAEIRKSAEDLGARMTADLERRIAVRSAEFEAELADRARQARQALEASLGTRRAELEAAVSRLEDRHVVLGNATEILERRERELTASVDGLSFKEASALDAIELRRAEREAEIKKSVEVLSAGMMSDLERRVAARSAELDARLAERERRADEAFAARSAELEAGLVERERQGLEALEASLGSKRAALESEVSSLENRRISLGSETELLEQRERELATSVAGLASREASVLEDLERRRTQREADIRKSVEELSAGMIGDLERRLAARSAEFETGLADRERQAREALQASLGARRAELHSQVSELEKRNGTLSTEIEQLQQKERELAASLEELSSREASAVQSVARLSRRILEEAPNPNRGSASASGS